MSNLTKQKRYLSRPPVTPRKVSANMRVTDLVELYTSCGAFQGGRLGMACKTIEQMLRENTTVALTLAGAMVPAGMGGCLMSLIERGFIDFLISTGANLYHDMHFALGLPVHQGSPAADDVDLFDAGIERIYDVFITEKALLDTDKFVRDAARELSGAGPISTAVVHRALGAAVLKHAPHPEKSLLATAAKFDVPIYTSSPGDSSIGMNLCALKLAGKGLQVDPDLDVLETTALVAASDKSGVIIIGGGSPKNFFLQTQPTLWQILGINKGGHDYDVQIGVDSPHWGGLSGATPSEAVSWGKINPDELDNSVVVYSDATIALPIIAAYLATAVKAKKPKRLYPKRAALLEQLRKDWQKTRRGKR